jgi:hypothetical protein
MATIKLQPSGKVVLKDGKVACGCCEECCMYPAQGLADAIYTADDLPDDVTVNGTIFPKSGTAYGDTTNGVIFEEDVWAKYTSGVRSSRLCLIQGGVEDEFASTYNVSSPYFSSWIGNVTVTRNSLCEWSGEAEGQFDDSYPNWLADWQFHNPGVPSPLTKKIQAGITMNGTTWTVWMRSDCAFKSITNSLVQGDDNFKHSNTPAGNYGDGYHSNALSVTQ